MIIVAAASYFRFPIAFARRASTMSTTAAAFHPNLRGVFVGSGSDGMSDPRMADAILEMAAPSGDENKKSSTATNVLYLGTATYDLPMFRTRQTQCFADRGCKITSLDVALESKDSQENQKKIEDADVIVVGGGNTLFAIDRWTKLG